jgi:hypothetical protein
LRSDFFQFAFQPIKNGFCGTDIKALPPGKNSEVLTGEESA